MTPLGPLPTVDEWVRTNPQAERLRAVALDFVENHPGALMLTAFRDYLGATVYTERTLIAALNHATEVSRGH